MDEKWYHPIDIFYRIIVDKIIYHAYGSTDLHLSFLVETDRKKCPVCNYEPTNVSSPLVKHLSLLACTGNTPVL